MLALKPVFNTAVPPTSARYDLAPNGTINIGDVLALKPVFGPDFEIRRHIEMVIIVVVLLSISPGIYAGVKTWLDRRKRPKPEATVV